MGYETTVLGHSREAFLAIELVAILFLAAGIVVASVLADRTGAGRMLAWGFAGTIVVGFLLGPLLGAASLFVVWMWPELAAFGRSEERRVGKEGGSTGRARWWP